MYLQKLYLDGACRHRNLSDIRYSLGFHRLRLKHERRVFEMALWLQSMKANMWWSQNRLKLNLSLLYPLCFQLRWENLCGQGRGMRFLHPYLHLIHRFGLYVYQEPEQGQSRHQSNPHHQISFPLLENQGPLCPRFLLRRRGAKKLAPGTKRPVTKGCLFA